MHIFLLLLDFLINGAFVFYTLMTRPDSFYQVLIVMLFFFAFRALSLSVHIGWSIANLILLVWLWKYDGLFVLVAYLLYASLYIYLSSRELRVRELEEQNRLLQLSNQSLRQLRIMQEQLEQQRAQTILFEERSRISQKIHDMLGHSLVAALLQLEAALSLRQSNPEKSFQMVETSTGTLREGVEHIRGVVREMNISPGVRKFSELELLVEELQTRSGRPIQLTLRGDPKQIPYRYWGIFTSQLEESLSNSVRHSQATELFVRLEVLPKHVRFEVRDNGESGVNISPGMGIESMKERAMAAGGRLILDATQGVSVTSLLPLEEET